MNFAAVIPTIGEAPQLTELLDVLLVDGCEQIWLTVDSREAELPDAAIDRMGIGIIYLDRPIYRGWNFGIINARCNNIRYLAILNDDVELEPGAVPAAVELMKANPDVGLIGLDYRPGRRPRDVRRVTGSYRQGGVGGWAFVLDTSLLVECDESYEWWFGDDDLFLQVERLDKRLAIADGCHVSHKGETTARNHPWTGEAKLRDQIRFQEKWGVEV